ncbi:hypothetical protein J5N97_016506 [Dioscorea zingiberensis]|uniref:FAD-binding domain-containing protein n=1 Tax=Dioscorea zingiberensis TaxID=325984 RepID=A0A9D5CJH4_9LILI|nr:hypothetical protein J5N97_016506 [Dioscorea zingiberensis]
MEVLNIGENVVHEVVIVGAGIAGLAVAVALKKVGIKSLVLEKSSELRSTGAALLIFHNAWRALEVLGVTDKLDKPYEDFQFGKVRMRPIHRKFLLETLAAELPSKSIRFLCKLSSVKSEVSEDFSTVVIGCDGVHSMVARWLGLSAPISSGRSAVRGLSLYPEGHGLKKQHNQYFMGNGIKGGFVPISHNEIYWYLNKTSSPQGMHIYYTPLIPQTFFYIYIYQEIARDPEMIKDDVLKTAKDFPPEYHQVVSNCDLSTLTMAPLLFRVPWDIVFVPSHHGGVTVTGDAFHPMTPDLAQGGCSALEDAIVLARNIANMPNNVCYGIENYVKERRWRAARLVTASYFSGMLEPCQSRGVFGRLWESFRQYAFNWLLHSKYGTLNYDCGTLPPAQSFSLN